MVDPSTGSPGPAARAALLTGAPAPWGVAGRALLAACVLAGLAVRLWGLSAEGFGDDEVHKWLAVGRYLHGDFSGDDVEHPMLMKSLIALVRWVAESRGVAMEAITRLPNALAGGLMVLVVALLGRRLSGRAAGLFAAGLAAASTTLVGYQRVAKEDTLLGLFLALLCWCLAEAKAAADDGRAAEQRRWELWGALSLAGLIASKYFLWLALSAPLFVLWVRGQTAWRVSWKRWGQLIGVAFLAWIAVNWSPFLPSTWEYAKSYTTGQQTVHGSLFFMGRIYHNLVEWGWSGTPPWFYAVFTAVKLAPGTFLLAVAGLLFALRERRPAHKLLLSWIGVWAAIHCLSGSKWGRFYLAVYPAVLVLAAHAAARLSEWAEARRTGLAAPSLGLLALLSIGDEARNTVAYAPHQRLYVSPLGGGEARLQWYFPHCDYFDAGFREAVQEVARRAEPGAELSTEIDWPSKLYAEQAGRPDLVHTLVRRGRTCRQGRVCYVVVQAGRLYFLNQDAVENLAKKTPWHVVSLRGQEVVKVYRLPPGESPFADENGAR